MMKETWQKWQKSFDKHIKPWKVYDLSEILTIINKDSGTKYEISSHQLSFIIAFSEYYSFKREQLGINQRIYIPAPNKKKPKYWTFR